MSGNKDFVYIEDNTKNGDGYWVLMKEHSNQSMILFTGLKKETAENFKKRLDNAIERYHSA